MNFGGGGYYCPRCDKRAYFAEEIIAMGKHWHKSCFTCANCKKRLDSRTCTDREGEAFCNICYKRMFGPKGYGYGNGAGTLSMDSGDPDLITTSNVSTYSQAQVPTIANGDQNSGGSNGQYSPRSSSSASSGSGGPLSPVTGTSQLGGAGDRCRRCGKNVYLAEKMIGAGAVWHKLTCFTCSLCNKRLESTSLCEKENELYCKTCYARNFGPKGYGYGVGAGTLGMNQWVSLSDFVWRIFRFTSLTGLKNLAAFCYWIILFHYYQREVLLLLCCRYIVYRICILLAKFENCCTVINFVFFKIKLSKLVIIRIFVLCSFVWRTWPKRKCWHIHSSMYVYLCITPIVLLRTFITFLSLLHSCLCTFLYYSW